MNIFTTTRGTVYKRDLTNLITTWIRLTFVTSAAASTLYRSRKLPTMGHLEWKSAMMWFFTKFLANLTESKAYFGIWHFSIELHIFWSNISSQICKAITRVTHKKRESVNRQHHTLQFCSGLFCGYFLWQQSEYPSQRLHQLCKMKLERIYR